MKKTLLLSKSICLALGLLAVTHAAFAQCSATIAPVYTESCSHDYYESISASGVGVSSTISVSGITSCSGTYVNDTPSQGITAPEGATVTVHVNRASGYTAYLSVYVDWNHDHLYETTELCGSVVTIPTSSVTATYTFTVPSTGVVTGTHLNMRMMISESATGAPCNATYGQTYDFFFVVGSGCTTPVLTFSPSSNDTICSGEAGEAITVNGAGVGGTYTWAPATGLSATTGATVTANPATTTVYTVTGTSTASCSATYLDTVTIVPPISVTDTIHADGPVRICAGDSVLLTGITGAHYRYQWYNGGTAFTHGTTSEFEVYNTGSYTLHISYYGCITISDTINVTTLPAPLPVITTSGRTLHTASGYSSYQWYEGGSSVSGATADSLVTHSNGTYSVTVTDANGCTGTSEGVTISGLGVTSVNAAAIRLYPNPAHSVLYVESAADVTVAIISMEGQEISRTAQAREINIASLPAGLYLVELIDESGRRIGIQKLVKN